ncbi:CopG family transcriptional regulator [Geothermobacter ehrlichii]|uniref:Putative nickel-responsive regulator n=1 Tax=Geothermobacter ehrlichii TaxID=213224 RepID=A0A5D3WI45_9BACT|nr:nickel-responsive transcriptional regulator NikR [Geothermobacter ehrlichii]TYO97147.1 CopG family transcriptional regulator [Geothermobacter ehrlichii]
MPSLTRFGISIDQDLLDQFDRLIARKGYANRSEAIRDLIRNSLVEDEWQEGDRETVGTITLVYDHHTRDLADKLTEHQHSHHDAIISALHVHLDAHHCLEVVVARGSGSKVKKLADELIGTKGVVHGKLTMATTGKQLR